jgi:hypothetical protein
MEAARNLDPFGDLGRFFALLPDMERLLASGATS